MPSWIIGELARRSGIAASAIRYYESVGLLPAPPRASGWRQYDPATLERLRVIKAARDLGFSVREIQTLLEGFPPDTPPSDRWQAVARRKLPQVEARLRQIEAMKFLLERGLECGCQDIGECLSSQGEACLPASEAAELESPADPAGVSPVS